MVEINMPRLRQQLILGEALMLSPYRCPAGKLTIGVGRNLDANPLSPAEIKVIGHNGRGKPITKQQALYLLDNDIALTIRALDLSIGWWRSLDEVRQRVLIDMAFNLGLAGLLKFKHFLAALQQHLYGRAAAEMKSSLWYEQTGTRGTRLFGMMESGMDYLG